MPVVLAGLMLLSGCTTSPEYIPLHPVYRMKVINTFNIAAVSYQTPVIKMAPVTDKQSTSGSNRAEKIERWQDVAQKLDLPDFTVSITRQLVRGMSARAGLRNLKIDHEPLPLPPKKDLTFYKTRYSDSNYVLEVLIKDIAVETGKFDGNSHALTLHAQAQMIRQYYSKVIWKYHCIISGTENKTYGWQTDDFYDAEGKRIKQVISQAIVDCAKSMVDDYLNNSK